MNILVIDTQEPINKLSDFKDLGFIVKREKLTVGDYYFACEQGEILIERKKQPDYDTSLVIDHLFDQAERLKAWVIEKDSRLAFIVFIGSTDVDNTHAGVNPHSRVGSMGSIIIRGMPILGLSTEEDFNWLIKKLCKSLEQGKMGEPRYVDLFKYKNTDANKIGMTEKIFRLVSGVGIDKARDIAKNFDLEIKLIPKDKDEISTNPEDLLVEIKGIGKKNASNIINALNLVSEE